jgi:hypothetical protein
MAHEDLGLGKLIIGEAHRDAVHVAVAPVVAQENLSPGDHVDANGGWAGERVGIVDPFLREPVRKGDRFWLFLYPGTVTGLRHMWTHPAFAPARPSAQKGVARAE